MGIFDRIFGTSGTVEKAVDGILLFMHKGIRFAMNDFNKKNQTANTNK